MSARLMAALYIRGQSQRSMAAIALVRQVFEAHIPGNYRLDVVDVQQQPHRTSEAGIKATPTLMRLSPPPELRIVGMLNEERVLTCLAVPKAAEGSER